MPTVNIHHVNGTYLNQITVVDHSLYYTVVKNTFLFSNNSVNNKLF